MAELLKSGALLLAGHTCSYPEQNQVEPNVLAASPQQLSGASLHISSAAPWNGHPHKTEHHR